MRSFLITTGLLLLIGWLGWGCQSGSTSIGQDIITPNQLEIQYVDTVSVFTSTVMVPDTFATSGDTTFLAGHWIDAQTGRSDAASFGSAGFTSNSLADQTDIVYDSLVLELPYSYVYGDTTQPVTLTTFTLQAPLESGKTYYNNNSAAFGTVPFAQRTFYPRPRSGREAGLVRIRLSDDLGRQLYGKIRDRSIENADEFKAFLPGLAFTSTSAANLFLGFSVNYSNIALYYHQIAASTTKIALRFNLNGAHFNRALNDFTGSPLQTLKKRGDRVSSTKTNHTTYLTAGPALRTRVEFPALGQLNLLTSYAGVNGAQLVVQPIFKTQRDYLKVGLPVGRAPIVAPSTLSLYETNDNNELVGVVPSSIGSTNPASAAYQGYDPFNPYALTLNDNYTFDISQYVLQILRNDRPYRPLMVIMSAPQGTTTMERLTIGDRFNSTDPIRLRLLLTYTK